MHPRIVSTRTAQAYERLGKAARKLARHHGLGVESRALESAQATPRHRPTVEKQMLEAEALADLLESITGKMDDYKDVVAQANAPEPEPMKPVAAKKPVAQKEGKDEST